MRGTALLLAQRLLSNGGLPAGLWAACAQHVRCLSSCQQATSWSSAALSATTSAPSSQPAPHPPPITHVRADPQQQWHRRAHQWQSFNYISASAAAQARQQGNRPLLDTAPAEPFTPPTKSHPLAPAIFLATVKSPVVYFKKPAEVIDPTSPMLNPKQYRTRLHPRRLIARVRKRKNITHLLTLLTLYQKRIDGYVLAAVVTKIGNVYRAHRDPTERAEIKARGLAVLQWIQPYMRFQLRWCSAHIIATILWAYARLPQSMRGEGWSRDLLTLMFARACAPPTSGDPRQHQLRFATTQTVCLLPWAMARILAPDHAQGDPMVQASCEQVATYAARRIGHFSTQGLALLASSMVTLSHTHGGDLLESHIANEAAKRIGNVLYKQFDTWELIALIEACGEAGFQHQQLFERALGVLLGRVGSLTNAQAYQLRAAMALAGIRHEGLEAQLPVRKERVAKAGAAGDEGAGGANE